jgi:hypothetical protein
MNSMETPNRRWSLWHWLLIAIFAIGPGTPIVAWIKSEWDRNQKFHEARSKVTSEHVAELQAYAERTNSTLPLGGLMWRGDQGDIQPEEVTRLNPIYGSFHRDRLRLIVRGMSIRVDRDATTGQWQTTIKPR